ncbi:hypothetical protein DIPPA_16782 [Diplonema papillatum]|nr:hypothetical protein DIPPA_16782 [Diplonema papillatum]
MFGDASDDGVLDRDGGLRVVRAWKAAWGCRGSGESSEGGEAGSVSGCAVFGFLARAT